jgi:tRNA G46 methylase TrmB
MLKTNGWFPGKDKPGSPGRFLKPIDFQQYFDQSKRPFQNDPGCGQRRFLPGHTGNLPTINFIGIDRLLARLKTRP